MLGRKHSLCSHGVNLLYFQDSDTGDKFKPEEYKMVKKVIRDGHLIEAHFTELDDATRHFISSRVLRINRKWFNTEYKSYRYFNPD